MCHTQKSYAWIHVQLISWVEVLTQCYLINYTLNLFTLKPHPNFFFCAIKRNTWKDSLVGLFNLSPALGMICVNKNVHLLMQHPSLRSIIEGPTDTSEILILMPRPGQELFIYICLNPVKTADFMHPKWEGNFGCIKSSNFVVVCKKHFVLPKFRQKLSMDKNQHQIKKEWPGTWKNHTQAYSSVKQMRQNGSCFRIDWKRIQQTF